LSGARYCARDTLHKQPIEHTAAHIRYSLQTLDSVYIIARPKSGVTARVRLIFTTRRRNLLPHSATQNTNRLHHDCQSQSSIQQLRHVGNQVCNRAVTVRVSMGSNQPSIINTSDVGEAHSAPAKSPCIDNLKYCAATDDNSGQTHPHFPVTTCSATTISDVVDTFLSNIKVRYCGYRGIVYRSRSHITLLSQNTLTLKAAFWRRVI